MSLTHNKGRYRKTEIRPKAKHKHRGAKSEGKNEEELARDVTQNEIIYKNMSGGQTVNKDIGVVFNQERN